MERLFYEKKQKTMFKQNKRNHHALVDHSIRVCSYRVAVISREIKDLQKPALEWHDQNHTNPQVSGCTSQSSAERKMDSYFSFLWQQLGVGRSSVYLNKTRRCITYLSFAGQLFSDHATPGQVSEDLLFL